MTNFEPLKEKVWEAVLKSDKTAFNDYCYQLMQKACGDWWRIGWNIYPKNVDDVIKLIDTLAKEAHNSWLAAMKCGDAPAEDVSPGEGFALCSKLIQEVIKNK